MRRSKRLRQAGILEHSIGGVTRHNLAVHRERRVRDGAVPDFVIAFALPYEVATSLAENAPDLAGKVGHGLRDHQFRLLDRAQFLPIDDDRDIARGVTKSRFKNIRHNHLETFDQAISRRRLCRDPALSARCNPYVRFGVVECIEG